MTFIHGFTKCADTEADEYKKARPVQDMIYRLFSGSLAKEVLGKEPKVGDRILYKSETGWKEGAWGCHTKGCSADEPVRTARNVVEDKFRESTNRKNLKKEDRIAVWDSYRKMLDEELPYPHKHGDKNWGDEAIKIGDWGTIVKADNKKDRYDITWDRYPDCVWPNYGLKDFVYPELGFQVSAKYWLNHDPDREAVLKNVRALVGDTFKIVESKSRHWPTTARAITFIFDDLELAKLLSDKRYEIRLP